jgi:hypothetical protein
MGTASTDENPKLIAARSMGHGLKLSSKKTCEPNVVSSLKLDRLPPSCQRRVFN